MAMLMEQKAIWLPSILSLATDVGLTRFTGRHKPVPGGLTVAIQATDTRETGDADIFRHRLLNFSGNHKNYCLGTVPEARYAGG